MKSFLLVIAVFALFVASCTAASVACDGDGAKCVGPVYGIYLDKKCKTLSSSTSTWVGNYNYYFTDGNGLDRTKAENGNNKCLSDDRSKTSLKWSCGSRIVERSYMQTGCKGPATTSYTYPTGKCVQYSNDRWIKLMCASASTASYSVALLALLALIALFLF